MGRLFAGGRGDSLVAIMTRLPEADASVSRHVESRAPSAARSTASRLVNALLVAIPALALGFLITAMVAAAQMEPGRHGLAGGAILVFRAGMGALVCGATGGVVGFRLSGRRPHFKALATGLILSLAVVLAALVANHRAQQRRAPEEAVREEMQRDPKPSAPTTAPMPPATP